MIIHMSATDEKNYFTFRFFIINSKKKTFLLHKKLKFLEQCFVTNQSTQVLAKRAITSLPFFQHDMAANDVVVLKEMLFSLYFILLKCST